MDNQKDSAANPNPMSPILEPDKKSNTVKLALILVIVVVVGAVVWSAVSGGDDTSTPATTNQPESQGETGQPAAVDGGGEAGSGVSSGTDGAQAQSSTDSGQATTPGTTATDQSSGSDVGQQTDSNPALTSGSYVDYQDQAQLDQLADTDRWLNFHAPWCPYCVHLDDDINASSSDIPDGVTIVKIDFDSNQDLRVRYGVTRQTTIVRVDADGNETDRFIGYGQFASLDNLAAAFGY